MRERLRAAGLCGAIIPDLPFEEGTELYRALDAAQLDPIFIYSPSTSAARMGAIAQRARGFVYCGAPKGVTGAATDFDALGGYLQGRRAATSLPLALGFGVQSRQDIAALTGRAAVAVVGSETVRVVDREEVQAVGAVMRGLRQLGTQQETAFCTPGMRSPNTSCHAIVIQGRGIPTRRADMVTK